MMDLPPLVLVPSQIASFYHLLQTFTISLYSFYIICYKIVQLRNKLTGCRPTTDNNKGK